MYSAQLIQAATFNYDMVFKVAKAISDEVRAKVGVKVYMEYEIILFLLNCCIGCVVYHSLSE